MNIIFGLLEDKLSEKYITKIMVDKVLKKFWMQLELVEKCSVYQITEIVRFIHSIKNFESNFNSNVKQQNLDLLYYVFEQHYILY